MAYSIQTEDGILIEEIPDDIPPDSPVLQQRVQEIRAQQSAQPAPPVDNGTNGGIFLPKTDSQSIQPTQQAPTQQAPKVDDGTNGSPFLPKTNSQTPLEMLEAGIPAPSTGGFLEQATGAAPSIASALVGGSLGELAGLLTIPTDPTGARPLAERISSSIFLEPNSIEGQAGLQALAENPVIQGIAEIDTFIRGKLKEGGQEAPFVGGDILAALGDFLPSVVEAALGIKAITAAPQAATKAGQAVTAAERAAGGAVARVVQEAPDVARKAGELAGEARTAATNLLPGRQTAKELIQSGAAPNSKAAGFLLQGERVVKDKIQNKAIDQGFESGVTQLAKQSSPATRKKMSSMVDIVQRRSVEPLFKARNRSSDVIGDSLSERIDVVIQANRSAGSDIKVQARKLKGKTVNAAVIGDNFIDDLAEMGVIVDPNTKAINFKGSDIEGLDAPEAVITRMVKRMSDQGTVDAHDLHRFKKFIDENVSFGKTPTGGLSGATEGILKGMRRDIRILLGDKFPDYGAANQKFSKTREALDDFQDIVGSKIKLTDENAGKAFGTLSRRVLSNAQSRTPLIKAIDNIDAMAKDLVGGSKNLPAIIGQSRKSRFDDDIMSQIIFQDELERVFGNQATSGFEGGIEKATATALRGVTSPKTAALEVGGQLIEAAKGINPENAIKSIQELLKR